MHSVPFDEQEVARLVASATRADGHPPLSGNKLASIGGRRSRTGAWSDGSVTCAVAVAVFHEAGALWALEIAVASGCRDSRLEEASIRAAVGLVADVPVHTIWAFRSEQVEAAKRLGYRETRAVLRMTGPIPEETTGPPSLVSIGTMRPGDIGAIIAVNNRAFPGHPEQGAMSGEDFALLMNQPWFTPEGVLIAREGERVAGFCITKYEGDRIGEIFVIAVDPTDQHSGVGRSLVGAGFEALRRRGVETVKVWVDDSNEIAVRFYGSFGFTEDFKTRELARTRGERIRRMLGVCRVVPLFRSSRWTT